MVAAMDGHIVVDENGRARIAGSRIRVIDLVLEHQVNGWTVAQLHEQFPHLSLGQIHAAFAYYYSHQAELDSDILRRFQRVEAMRAQTGESSIVQRLKAEGRLK